MPQTSIGSTGVTFPDSTVQASAAALTGATTNAVSSSALTLTSSSTQYQVVQINSVANSIVNLPAANTPLGKGYASYIIENRSPIGANLTIKDNGGNIVGYIPIGQIGVVGLKDNSTAAGVWEVTLSNPQTFFNWDGTSIATNTLTGTYLGIIGLTATTFVRFGYATSGGGASFTFTLYGQACTISGSTITYGSISSTTAGSFSGGTSFSSSEDFKFWGIRLSNTAFVLKLSGRANDSTADYQFHNFRTCTVSGTTITYGTSSSGGFPGGTSTNSNSSTAGIANGTVARLSDTSFALVYNDGLNDSYTTPYNYSGSLACQIVTVSGTTQTVGTKVQLSTSTYTNPVSIVGLSSSALFIAYGQLTTAGVNGGRSKIVIASVSGTTPTFGTPVSIESSDNNNILNVWGLQDGAVGPSATQAIFNIGYGVAEATASGTTPTYDSLPSGTNIYPLYLASATKAWGSNNTYLNITTGGFVLTTGGTNVLQPTYVITPVAKNPLGAQPTTAFVGVSSTNNNINILGTTV
jgi:hypothetical protein